MKRKSIIYWVTTGLVSASMLVSASSYFISEEAKEAFTRLGFPGYFRIELGIAKFLGVFALLLPGLPGQIKMFAYFGFTIAYVSAIISHVTVGDPIMEIFKAITLLALLCVSYMYFDPDQQIIKKRR